MLQAQRNSSQRYRWPRHFQYCPSGLSVNTGTHPENTSGSNENFIECLLSGIQKGSNSCSVSVWRYVLFTVMLHTAHVTFLHANLLYTRSVLNYTISSFTVFQSFTDGCWGHPAWIHIRRWVRVQPHKSKKRDRNITGHRAIINVPGQRGGDITLSLPLHRMGFSSVMPIWTLTTHLTFSHCWTACITSQQ